MASNSFKLPFPANIAAGVAGAAALTALIAKSRATKVNDLKTSPGGIKYMSGPAGTFELNPRDSVLATTNKINEGAFNGATMTTATTANQKQNINVNVTTRGVTRGKDLHDIVKKREITGDFGVDNFLGGALV